MATIVTGDKYKKFDGKLDEIKRQLKQKGGYPFDLQMLNRALQLVIEGKFEALGLQFPCQLNCPELIPDKWEVLEDVESTPNLNIAGMKFESFLKDGESYIGGDEMRQRAVMLKGNLGLSDAKYFLEHQSEILTELRGKYIVFPGTKLRVSVGDFHVAYLHWYGDRWVLNFNWLDSAWFGHDLVACSE